MATKQSATKTFPISSSCHCGAVALHLKTPPRQITECNCSICRRNGSRWAYYAAGHVQIEAKPGATEPYIWGDKMLELVRCTTCGCVMFWRDLRSEKQAKKRMGVNTRMMDFAFVKDVPVRYLDGAESWKETNRRPRGWW